MKFLLKPMIITAMCISLLVQTGCWDQKLYEQIGFVLQLGLEAGPDDKLTLSMTYPTVESDVESKSETLFFSKERLIRASRERLRDVSGKILQGGKIQLVYFSKSLAEKGMEDFLEIFFRDPENPLMANVVVVDGSPKEMMELSVKYKDKPRSSFYVNNLLLDARRRLAAPEARVFNFSILKYSKTIDPIAPLVKYNEENIEAIGSALFNGDKMVGEIDTDQTMLLNLLLGKRGGGEYTYQGQLSNESSENLKRGATLSIMKSKRKISIDIKGNTPMIHIKLGVKSFLDEYAGNHNLDEDANKKKLEETITKSLQTDSLELLKHLQKMGADPIGFGEIVRSKQNKYWKSVNWKEVYKNAVFTVDAKVDIESYGTIK